MSDETKSFTLQDFLAGKAQLVNRRTALQAQVAEKQAEITPMQNEIDEISVLLGDAPKSNKTRTVSTDIKEGTVKHAILNKMFPGSVYSAKDIARETGKEVGSVSVALTGLIDAGLVVRPDRGQYKLSAPYVAPVPADTVTVPALVNVEPEYIDELDCSESFDISQFNEENPAPLGF